MKDVTIRNYLQEEVAIMSCYNITTKQTLTDSLLEALPYVENASARDLMDDCITKLQNMSDSSYPSLKGLLEDPKVF